MLGSCFIRSQQNFVVSAVSLFTLHICFKSTGSTSTQDIKRIIQFGKTRFHHAKTHSDKYSEEMIKS